MKSHRMIARTLVLFAIFVLASLSVSAQVTKGSISGTVVDASGAVISDASLKATNTQTGVVYTATTEKSGLFRFSLIPPGSYKLEITKTGFETKVIGHLTVGTSQDAGLGAVALAVAGTHTDVQVSETEAPLIETTQAQITNSFAPQNIELLTGVNENQGMDNLALLVPGVNLSRDNNMANSNGATFTSNGIRGRANDQQIDGQNNNDNSVTGPSISISDAEFVAEYQIITNNFGPEYGRNGGSVVNIVTKSGTNNLHGSIYGNWTSNKLETLTNIEKKYEKLTSRPRSNTEFGGFTIGFPLLKNKAFFFNGFDEQLYHETALYHSDLLTPTPTGLSNVAACAGVNANALAALKAYGPYGMAIGSPVPTNAGVNTISINGTNCDIEMGGITRAVPSRSHIFNWIPRFDYQTGKDTFTARYILNRNNDFGVGDLAAAGYFYNVPSFNQALKLGWTRTITQNLVNELSISYGRNNVMFDGGTEPAIGDANKAVTHISFASGASSLGFGGGTTMPQGRLVNTYQIQDNLNYQLGKHHLKAGINYTHQLSMNPFLPNQNGSFSFADWANYFQSTPSTVSVADGINILHFKENDVFAYVGDDWQYNKNLTFNLGLTYSFYGQPANLFHDNDMKLQTGKNPLWNPTLPLSVTTAPSLPSDYKLLAPSAGFAWSPDFLSGVHKTVIRGGYRFAYDPPFYNIYLNMSSSAPQVFSQTFSSAAIINGLLPANPIGPNVRTALSSYLTKGIYDPRSYSQTKVDPNFTADKLQSWTLGIQRELSNGLVAEVRYVGNHASDLFQSINANPKLAALKAAYPGLVPTSITLGANGRTDGASSLIRTRINNAKSDYEAVQSQIRADSLFHQLFLSASYTFSKTTDNASEIYGTNAGGNTSAFSQNPINYNGAEHGLSGIDFPHNFTFNFAEQIPFQKNQRGVIGHVLGGWSISGTYYMASGQNYTPIQYGFDYYGHRTGIPDYSFNSSYIGILDNLRPFAGSRNARSTEVGAYAGDVCDYYGGKSCSLPKTQLISFTTANNLANQDTKAPVQTTKDQVRYIANGYYAQQAYGTPYGNVSRNDARDYWTNTGDMSFAKSIRLRENLKASLHANISNIFNHPNYSSIDPFIDDAGQFGENNGFGDPTVTSGGRRTITFSGKISW